MTMQVSKNVKLHECVRHAKFLTKQPSTPKKKGKLIKTRDAVNRYKQVNWDKVTFLVILLENLDVSW
jgi:hypothetical protein